MLLRAKAARVHIAVVAFTAEWRTVCWIQRIRRTSNNLSKPHLGVLAAPRGSRGRACLPHLATGFIHCSVLMIGSDRGSVRGRACGNRRSEATLEQPNGTG